MNHTGAGSHRSPGTVPSYDNDPSSAWDTETDATLLKRIEDIGAASVPVLTDLTERVPTIDGAMLCTADGYNMCALGLDENQVGRLAAMTSTLFSVSSGAMEAVAAGSPLGVEPLEQVTLRSGETQYMIFPIKHEQLGYVLMSLWAQNVTLGELLMEARISARELARIVHRDYGGGEHAD